MSRKIKSLIYISSAILLLIPKLASAEVFCVQNHKNLEDALSRAAVNKENDILQIVLGSKFNDFQLPKEDGYLIQIESGYSLNCSVREENSKILVNSRLPTTMQRKDILAQQSTTGPQPPEGVKTKPETLSGEILSGGSNITLLGVPGYAWRHGCGPTAVGMVAGYWDNKGCTNLFEGSASSQTSEVNQGIASQGSESEPRHYEDYSSPLDSYPNLNPDKSEPPSGDEHASDSIADFMYTSWSSRSNYYGWSWSNHITPAFSNYALLRDNSYISITATYYYGSSLTWDVLITEIDSQRPMVFLVDSNGDGKTDHFVTVVGYQIVGPDLYYGCLDTWSPYDTIRWELFRGMSASYTWGVWGGFSFQPSCGIVNKKINIVPSIIPLLLF